MQSSKWAMWNPKSTPDHASSILSGKEKIFLCPQTFQFSKSGLSATTSLRGIYASVLLGFKVDDGWQWAGVFSKRPASLGLNVAILCLLCLDKTVPVFNGSFWFGVSLWQRWQCGVSPWPWRIISSFVEALLIICLLIQSSKASFRTPGRGGSYKACYKEGTSPRNYPHGHVVPNNRVQL